MSKNKIKDNIESIDINDKYAITKSERTPESCSWYKVANENLITAKILLDNKRIPHTIFFLQQSIECIIKAILLENKFIDNVKDFNHKPEEAIVQFLKREQSDSVKILDHINEKMSNEKDFVSRLKTMSAIVNTLTTQYDNIVDLDKKIFKEKEYTKNIIYCFAILFSTTQQNTRYPESTNNNADGNNRLNLPNEIYQETTETLKGLDSIILFFEYILNKVYNHTNDKKNE
ncbi:MAG: HEPN domain-containing protein [Bacteroidales bacterium]|nr:HEPN domain-containing protein [Bacteroidales bacterium]